MADDKEIIIYNRKYIPYNMIVAFQKDKAIDN